MILTTYAGLTYLIVRWRKVRLPTVSLLLSVYC